MHPTREAATVAAGTLASRLLGFLRDMLLAHILGPGADAFLVAFRVPNFFRRLLAEGSLGMAHGAAVARLFSRKGEAAALVFTRRVALAAFLFSLPLTALLAAMAGPLILCMAPGFAGHPELSEKSALLLRLCLPYLPLCTLSAIAFAHQAAQGIFTPQAWSSALLNGALLFVGGIVLSLPPGQNGATAFDAMGGIESSLCLGVVAGGMLQALLAAHPWRDSPFLLPRRAGPSATTSTEPRQRFFENFSLRPVAKRVRRVLGDDSVRLVLCSMPATALGAAPHQLHVLAGTFLASFLAPGSISALYFAERLFELPMGLAGVTIGIVALPRLAILAEQRDHEAFAQTLADGVRLSAFLSLPAAAGLSALASPLAALLFGHGAYGQAEVLRTAEALSAYALGLPALCAARPLLAAVSALGEGRLPLKTACLSLAAAVPVSLIAMRLCPFAGYSAASGVSLGIATGAWVNAWLLLKHVREKGIQCPLRMSAPDLVRYAAGTAALAVALAALSRLPLFQGTHGSSLLLAAQLLSLVGLCILLWFALFLQLKSPDARALLALFRRGK